MYNKGKWEVKAGQSKDVVEFNKIEVCSLVKNAELIENQQILIALLEKFAIIKLITFLRNSDSIDLRNLDSWQNNCENVVCK